jgi:hypothetical protein
MGMRLIDTFLSLGMDLPTGWLAGVHLYGWIDLMVLMVLMDAWDGGVIELYALQISGYLRKQGCPSS